MSNNIVQHIGRYKELCKGDWVGELNIVNRNNQPVYDASLWNKSHSEYIAGMTFSREELEKLYEYHSQRGAYGAKYRHIDDELQNAHEPFEAKSDKEKLIVHKLAAVLGCNQQYTKMLTIASTPGGPPQWDIRNWEPMYKNFTPGLTLNDNELFDMMSAFWLFINDAVPF